MVGLFFISKLLLQLISLNALEGYLDRQDITLGIEVHLIDTSYSVITALCTEWVAVIDDVILAALLVVHYRVVASACTYILIGLQDYTTRLEWTHW